MADPLQDIAEQLYHVQELDYSYDGTAAQVGTFVMTSRAQQGNVQAVAGHLGGSPYVAAMYLHTYDRTTDTGHYTLAGASGSGSPIIAEMEASMDRQQDRYDIAISGTIGGVPFSATSADSPVPIVNPLYGFGQ